MPGLHIDEVGGGGNAIAITNKSYNDLSVLSQEGKLVPGQTYEVEYLHKYFIEGSNSSGVVSYVSVDGNAYGYGLLNNNNYYYGFGVGQEVIVTKLPEGYTGAIKVGDKATVTVNSSNYYWKFSNGMHNYVGFEMKFYTTRYNNIAPDSEIFDDYGNPVMIPKGVINTDVHNGQPYMDMAAEYNRPPKVEKLILTAKDEWNFHLEAKSLTYPGDIVEYYFWSNQVINDNKEVIGTRNGLVYRRKNEYLRIDIDADWRVQRFRRWLIDEDSQTKLLNQDLDIANTRLAYQGKWLFTASKRKVGENEYFYVARNAEGNIRNLDTNGRPKIVPFNIVSPIKAIDFTIISLDDNLDPVNVKVLKSRYFENSVFQGKQGDTTLSLEVKTRSIENSTFVSSPSIYDPLQGSLYIDCIALDAIMSESTCSNIRFRSCNFLSFTNFTRSINSDINGCIFGTMQNGNRIPNPSPSPVVWWLYIYVSNTEMKDSSFGGVTPQLHISSSKIALSSFFFYYSPQFNTTDGKYTREVIRLNGGKFSSVGLRMFGNLDGVEFGSMFFRNYNDKTANGLFLYDIPETLRSVVIKKNDTTKALFYETYDADYKTSVTELSEARTNPVDLKLSIIVDNSTPNMGDNVVFTLTAENLGAFTGNNVLATALLPDGFTYVSDNSNGTYNSITGEWNIGVLEAAASSVLSITASVNDIGNYTIDTTITGAEDETNPADNSASITLTPIPAA